MSFLSLLPEDCPVEVSVVGLVELVQVGHFVLQVGLELAPRNVKDLEEGNNPGH